MAGSPGKRVQLYKSPDLSPKWFCRATFPLAAWGAPHPPERTAVPQLCCRRPRRHWLWCPSVVLLCISLRTKDAEHLLWLLAILCSFVWNVCPFVTEWRGFFMQVLPIDIRDIFSWIVTCLCLFISDVVSFKGQMLQFPWNAHQVFFVCPKKCLHFCSYKVEHLFLCQRAICLYFSKWIYWFSPLDFWEFSVSKGEWQP